MKIFKPGTVPEPVLDHVICNQCGVKIVDEIELDSILSVSLLLGYDADGTYFNDGDELVFDLCQKCLRGLVDSFKFKPTITNLLGG